MKDDLVSLAVGLLKIPTDNPPGRNCREFTMFVTEWLSETGLDVETIEVPKERLKELTPSVELPRFHAVSTLKGSKGSPRLYLHGHYDTVPVCAGWKKDPFNPTVEKDRLYGLGASDMKGGITAMMIAAKALVECDAKLVGDLVITTTGDEEANLEAGVSFLLKQNLLSKAEYAIVGEPTGVSNIMVGMKGAIFGSITVTGKSAHGSVPSKGINAFEKIARIVVAIEDQLKLKLKRRVSMYPFVPKESGSPTLMLGGTVKIGGKSAASMVPGQCIISFDRRLIPEEKVDDAQREIAELLEDLKREDPELKVEMKVRFAAPPPPVTSKDSKICQVLGKAVKTVTCIDPTFAISSGGNESNLFQEYAKAQTVVCGPGVEHMCHSPDEYTLISQILMAAKIYALTALELLT